MAIDPVNFAVAVAGPELPQREVSMFSPREQSKSKDASMPAKPGPSLEIEPINIARIGVYTSELLRKLGEKSTCGMVCYREGNFH
jgi:hypothetical protein